MNPSAQTAWKPSPRVRRRGLIFLVLAAMLALAGATAGLFSWIKPLPRTELIFCGNDQFLARPIAALPQAERERDSLQAGQFFAHIQDLNAKEGRQLQQAMSAWKNQPVRDSVVVYLSGRAVRNDRDELCLLPGDAALDKQATWIRLREILERLRDYPARAKLLVLDIMHPWATSQNGVAADDIAAAVPGELDAVTDPERLVLCSCAAGQVSLSSEELGRSVFGYYFEEGLRGYADGYGDNARRDGFISVRELAAFVRARVDRWARHNRGQRQTPVLLGSSPDFPVLALAHRRHQPHLEAGEPATYPSWLHAAWQQRDQVWRDGTYRLAPRLFQQQQALLLEAERAWRAGLHADKLRQLQGSLETLHANLQRQLEKLGVEPHSLAQAQALGARVDANVPAALERLCRDAAHLLPGLRPDEAGPLRRRLLESFRAKAKNAPEQSVALAAFACAVADPQPEIVRLMDELATTPGSEPRYVETLRLRQLADLAEHLRPGHVDRETAKRLLRLTQLAERLHSQHAVAVLLRPWLEEAAQARHDAEWRLWATGFVAPADVDRRLRDAVSRYESLAKYAEILKEALATRDEGMAVLPIYFRFLEEEGQSLATWETAVAATKALDDALRGGLSFRAEESLPNLPATWDRLKGLVAPVQEKARVLSNALAELQTPFRAGSIARLVEVARQPRVSSLTFRQIDALLAVPHPALKAEDRLALVHAARTLSRRLHEETRQQDRDEDGQRVVTACQAAPDSTKIEYARGVVRARTARALAELVGLSVPNLPALIESAERNPTAKSMLSLAMAQRRVWAQTLPAKLQDESSESRHRLSWILPPLETIAEIDAAELSPTLALRTQQARRVWSWLGPHYQYQASEYRHGGLPAGAAAAASRFYLHAATAMGNNAAMPQPQGHLEFQTAVRPRIDKSAHSLQTTVQVKRFMPNGNPGPIEVSVTADRAWWKVTPEVQTLPEISGAAATTFDTLTVPIKIHVKEGSTSRPRPDGFLMQARFDGHDYHYLVPVPTAGEGWKMFLTTSPEDPTPVDELHLRPGRVPHKFYLFVTNPSDKARKVSVHVQAGELLLRGVVALEPQETRRLSLNEDLTFPDNKPRDVQGPLQLRLLDSESRAVLLSRTVPLTIIDPRDYVHVTDVQYEPGTRLSVQLAGTAKRSGPPVAAEIVVPDLQAPTGTLRGEVPLGPMAAPLTLFADNPRSRDGGDIEGTVFLHLDGVPRVLTYRNLVTPAAKPNALQRDDRPALRLGLPPFVAPTAALSGAVEVDNPPKGATLEVSLGTLEANHFAAEQTRTLADTKERQIRVQPSADGGLVFAAAVRDWSVTFDAAKVQGRRAVRARLLDQRGNEIRQTLQIVTIDSTPPTDLRFVRRPAMAKKGSTLTLTASVDDSDSGISSVEFFTGKPENGKLPAQCVRITAEPDTARRKWTARLDVPADQDGPLTVSVRAVNGAGMASFATESMVVTAVEPALLVPGKISGKVTEGERSQPNLTVILQDERGKEIARAKTRADGSYTFENVAAGRYQVFTVKPETGRRAAAGAIVEPGRTTSVPLPLAFQ